MTENTKTNIDELKNVVMDLYRSAGNLDKIIQDIERDLSDCEIPDNYHLMVAISMYGYRQEVLKSKGDLMTKEKDIFENLISSLKETES